MANPKFKFTSDNSEGAYPTSFVFDNTEIKKGDKIVATDLVDLYDTDINPATLADQDLLIYEQASEKWINLAGGSGTGCNLFNGYDGVVPSKSTNNINSLYYKVAQHTASVINGNMYIFGGINNGYYSNKLLVYNFLQQSILSQGSVNNILTRIGHISATYKNKLFIHGGYSNVDGNLNDLWEYDTITEEWTQLSSSPASLNGHIGVEFEGKLYLYGGGNSSGQNLTIYIYDIKLDRWNIGSTAPSVYHKRLGATAQIYNGRIYIFGGESNNTYYKCLWYDIKGDIFSDGFVYVVSIPNMVSVGVGASSVIIDDEIIIYAGMEHGDTISDNFFKFNISNETWEVIDDSFQSSLMPASGFYHTMCYFFGKLYTVGGSTQSNNYDEPLNDIINSYIYKISRTFSGALFVDYHKYTNGTGDLLNPFNSIEHAFEWLITNCIVIPTSQSIIIVFLNDCNINYTTISINYPYGNQLIIDFNYCLIQTNKRDDLSLNDGKLLISECNEIQEIKNAYFYCFHTTAYYSLRLYKNFHYSAGSYTSPLISGHTLTIRDSIAYVFGGHEYIDPINETTQITNRMFMCYLRANENVWEEITYASGTSIMPLLHHTAVMYNNDMYIYGGYSGIVGASYVYGGLWKYEFNYRRWTELLPSGSIPPERTGHEAFVYNNKMYIVSGKRGYTYYTDVWAYDFALNTWEQIVTSGYFLGRSYFAGCLYEGFFYVFGGKTSSYLNDMFKFDLSNNTWTRIWYNGNNSYPYDDGVAYIKMMIHDGKMNLIGGREPANGMHFQGNSNVYAIPLDMLSSLGNPYSDWDVDRIRNIPYIDTGIYDYAIALDDDPLDGEERFYIYGGINYKNNDNNPYNKLNLLNRHYFKDTIQHSTHFDPNRRPIYDYNYRFITVNGSCVSVDKSSSTNMNNCWINKIDYDDDDYFEYEDTHTDKDYVVLKLTFSIGKASNCSTISSTHKQSMKLCAENFSVINLKSCDDYNQKHLIAINCSTISIDNIDSKSSFDENKITLENGSEILMPY